jgi:membrane associated rhomboid family serine protease
MLPLQSLRPIRRTPYVTYGLIAINLLVFAWELILSAQGQLGNTFYSLATIPCNVSANPLAPGHILNAVFSMFLHGGWLHLIGNLAYLFALGPSVEEYYGRRVFLGFYLAAGFAADFVHVLVNSASCVPTIGASGAIAGVMAAYMLLYPGVRVKVLILVARFIPLGTSKMTALYLLGFWFIIQLFYGIVSLGPVSAIGGGVAFWGHIGGFVAGLLVTFFFTAFRPPPPVDSLAYLDE